MERKIGQYFIDEALEGAGDNEPVVKMLQDLHNRAVREPGHVIAVATLGNEQREVLGYFNPEIHDFPDSPSAVDDDRLPSRSRLQT